MELPQLQDLLGIILSIVAILGIPLGVYKFYVTEKKTDGDKINDTEKNDIKLEARIKFLEEADARHEKELERIRNQELTKMQNATEVNTKNIGDLTRLVDRLSTIVEIKVLGVAPKTVVEEHKITTEQK